AVVAPRFMEQHKPLRRQRQISISDEIPDVFAPAPQASSAPAAPEPEAPAATEAPAKEPEQPRDELGEIFGEPTRSDWPVQEIAQRSAKLPGVAGALIATPDGLLVAGSWPGEVKNDTVAAFLPQLHSRVTQFSNHLHLGEANHFLL